MNSYEKAEQRHNNNVCDLMHTLSKKKLGDKVMFMPHEKYSRTIDGVLYEGEWDLHVRVQRNGKWFDRYYEVKNTDCPPRYECAVKQFERTQAAFPERNFKFIYATETSAQRYRPNNR